MKRKMKKLTRHTQSQSWTEIRDSLWRAVTGYVNYYGWEKLTSPTLYQ